MIKVWCLPESEEAKLNELHQGIVRAVASVPEIGVSDEKDITCLFPTDMMKYGLGTEIIVEVTGLYDKPERTEEVRNQLAARIGEAVHSQYPDTELVECFVSPFNPAQGFWSSRQ
ncbi:MAG: hypothetical protein KC877_03565 [Candidatus Kaiserbacteria bacterium]|nr:hypothetical protein [Candidatus Kaiserbacteria bacterium]